jgi:2-polyprenyl-3-methyl-5-hydroxy-6-metoxy-1,4-benzoquinol methylase
MFLQRLANRYPTMRLQGVDVSDKLVAIARTQLQRHEVSIMLGSFLDIADRFDCITCIGVLQKTDMLLSDFFLHAFSCLEPGGELWVDTKHAGWDAFIAGERVPEQTHIHFSLTEIQSAALQNGFREIDCFGFLPGANETTSVAGSHTLIYRCMRPVGS